MERIVDKTVNLSLVGVDGNAFAILGTFRKQAVKEGWLKGEISLVIEQATSVDYNHLISTIMEYCEPLD